MGICWSSKSIFLPGAIRHKFAVLDKLVPSLPSPPCSKVCNDGHVASCYLLRAGTNVPGWMFASGKQLSRNAVSQYCIPHIRGISVSCVWPIGCCELKSTDFVFDFVQTCGVSQIVF